MKVPGLPALALALSSLVVIAWSISAASCGPGVSVWDCASPDGTYLGTADNNDPTTCPCFDSCCIDGPPNLSYPRPGVAFKGSCSAADGGIICGPGTVLMGNECVPASDGGDPGDAAADGPLPAVCSGACWPLPTPDWTPVLLWTGAEADAPSCLNAGLAVVFNGVANDAMGTFGLGCTSSASGTCAGPLDVCGPSQAEGFQQCIMHSDDLPCSSWSAYPSWYVFYEGTAPEPSLPWTFCCLELPDGGLG